MPTITQPTTQQWFDKLLKTAIGERASDIHLESTRDNYRLRFRIDGVLREKELKGPVSVPSVIQHIKILADLDITESRRPQDGHFELQVDKSGSFFNIRISVIPSIYGESVALRILNRSDLVMKLEALNFFEDQIKILRKIFRQPSGMLAVAGPAGSGKTTLLYSIINELNAPEVNIITLEDPVEYQFPYVNQVQVNPRVGLNFSQGLRSVLRHDPNIILVGEIRDQETAEIATRAALTGHLLLTTVHANRAVDVIMRLQDLGIGRATLATALRGIVSRRLVRKLCPECAQEYQPKQELLKELGFEEALGKKLLKPKGCPACAGTGYQGRIGVAEILPFDDEIRALVIEENSYLDIIKKVQEKGLLSLKQDGLRKVLAGLTTIEEILRVIE